MKYAIDRNVLKKLRKRRNLRTQGALADATKTASQRKLAPTSVHVQTISKIERGVLTSVGRKTLESLAAGLKCDPKVLTGELPMPEQESQWPLHITDRISLSRAQWQAVSAVALRYNVKEETVFEFASVLFAIFAEQSLAHRREDLVALLKQQNALEDAGKKMPHLGWRPCTPRDTDNDIVFAEQNSIKMRDLFAHETLNAVARDRDRLPADPDEDAPESRFERYPVANPFLTFIRQAAKDVRLSVYRSGQDDELLSLLPEESWLETITGGDDVLNMALQTSSILLRDIPTRLLDPHRLSERQEWLRERLKTDSFEKQLENLPRPDLTPLEDI